MDFCFGSDKGTEVEARKSRSDSGKRRGRPGVENRSHNFHKAEAAGPEQKRAEAAGQDSRDWVWMCRIAERVAGVIGVCPDGLDGLRIRLFRIDPEWQHTNIPRKLFESVRNYAQCSGRSRIIVEPRVAPRWLLESLPRHGFQFEGWRSVCDRELLEFSIDREPPPVERSKQRAVVRLGKRRPHWSTR
jgi:GNAT superfamily N-acetyltransferase